MNINSDQIISKYKNMKISGFNNNNLYIKNAGLNSSNLNKGLGVFTKTRINKGDVVEYSPVIVLQNRFNYYKNNKDISQYAYWYECKCKTCLEKGVIGLIPLGFGSIMNTSDENGSNNVDWFYSPQEKFIAYIAVKDILPEEELLLWFGQGYYDFWCKKNENSS